MTDAEKAARAKILSIRLDNKEVVTRQEATAAGITRYYTGKPCVHDHDATRLTSNGRCIECHRQRYKNRRNGFTSQAAAEVEQLKDEIKSELMNSINKEPEHMRVYVAEAEQRKIKREAHARTHAIQEIIEELEAK